MKLDLDDIERKATASKRKAFGQRVMIPADEVIALVAIARAAERFVDEQGKTLSRELVEHDHFASAEFDALVAAVGAAGR